MTGYNNTIIFTFSYTRNKVLRSNDSVLVENLVLKKFGDWYFQIFRPGFWLIQSREIWVRNMKYFSSGIYILMCVKSRFVLLIFFWLQAADSVKYCANKKKIYIFFFSEGYRRFFSQNTKKWKQKYLSLQFCLNTNFTLCIKNYQLKS